jgi:hypothetical protein
MKKIGLATLVTGGLAAAILGFAAPAQGASVADTHPVSCSTPGPITGIDHLHWLDDIRPKVNVPNVDTDVRHREIRVPLPS